MTGCTHFVHLSVVLGVVRWVVWDLGELHPGMSLVQTALVAPHAVSSALKTTHNIIGCNSLFVYCEMGGC